MTTSTSTPGAQGRDDPSTTIGVGGVTSGQQGATPSHETQQETGGSGGGGLTRNQSGETVNAPTGEMPGASGGGRRSRRQRHDPHQPRRPGHPRQPGRTGGDRHGFA